MTLYVDDAVSKRKTGFYMGILVGTGIFGPALAYLLGGVFSKIYVTLECEFFVIALTLTFDIQLNYT